LSSDFFAINPQILKMFMESSPTDNSSDEIEIGRSEHEAEIDAKIYLAAQFGVPMEDFLPAIDSGMNEKISHIRELSDF
jgi:hypothetical protein